MNLKKRLYYFFKKADFRIIFKELFLITLGITSAAFGLKSFLLPNHFIDGGAVGISLIINILTDKPLALILIIVNIPFVLLGFRQISKMFAYKTITAISVLALALTLDVFPVITSDKLLIAVFGGFFLGAGIGLTMRGGAVIDGTEVLALYISKKIGLSVGDIIMVINIIIFSFAAFTINMETALYAILTYLSAAKTVDFVIHGIEEYTGVTIISAKSDAVRQAITKIMGRAVTIYKGERGYIRKGSDVEKELDIVYTVITRLEITKLKSLVKNIDNEAFMVMHTVDDTQGGMIKRRALH